ncbi:hypothetical protein [Actinacidiphila yeochonensis]|uniref:hypothetical protein n=1 Tax=Actinacidiphila yeochonensis TaxID=89050 RepID=UPI000AA8FBFE|nr:hypothetical protein [Actinacidiphila yeochonensis]
MDTLDVFALDPQQQSMTAISAFDTDGDTDGDTTGDGCGESPPQGPTSGCLIPD